MGLREDVSAGLVALGGTKPVTLDDSGSGIITIPMPPTIVKLENNRLMIRIQVAKTGDFFTLSTPLAELNGSRSTAFLNALLHRNLHATQTSGLTFAISADEDGLIALYHWMLEAISPEQFRALVQKFSTSTLDLLDEINEMARRESGVKPVHEGYV